MSDLHPHALSLDEDALEHPDFQRVLTDDLAAMAPPDIIHRFRAVGRDGQQTEVLKAAGFSVTRLTRLIDLPLNLDLPHALEAHIAPHWFGPEERGPWEQWLDAHWRHYDTLHQSNPPQQPAQGLAPLFAGADLIAAFALRDGPQGRVLSFASLREGEELGWIGGRPDLLDQTLSACLRRAAALGWSKATLEVDDDDRPLWALASDLPGPTRTFVTWHRERQPSSQPH
ncbi:MAG: hypothetical protein AAGL89_14180 [Pseudomonadota bacterium]